MKRSQRVGALMEIISNSPNKIFSLNEFCDLFSAAKSSISEDIAAAREIAEFTGLGLVETISGAAGGVRYVPFISKEKGLQFQEKLCRKLGEENRVLGGGFLYTSDIMFDPVMVKEMAQIFARKGIPLALKTAEFLNLPSVVVRREAKISEGATMSINYLSGSSERMQKMSISKRAALSGCRALIIDDFMRGGGSVKGISDILSEFETQVVGIGVAIANIAPEKKKIADYIPLVYLGHVDEEHKTVEVFPNSQIF